MSGTLFQGSHPVVLVGLDGSLGLSLRSGLQEWSGTFSLPDRSTFTLRVPGVGGVPVGLQRPGVPPGKFPVHLPSLGAGPGPELPQLCLTSVLWWTVPSRDSSLLRRYRRKLVSYLTRQLIFGL